jgi:hypothetical protein
MSPEKPTNPAVRRLVAAIDSGDRDAFLAALTPDATLTDDGNNPRSLTDWIDRQIFSVHGHLTIEREEGHGLHLLARYRNDNLGEMSTYWRFQVAGTRSAALTPARREPRTNLQDVRPRGPERQIQPTLTLGGPGPSRDESHGASRAQIWLIGTQRPPEASSAARHTDSAGRDRSAGAFSFTLRDRACS